MKVLVDEVMRALQSMVVQGCSGMIGFPIGFLVWITILYFCLHRRGLVSHCSGSSTTRPLGRNSNGGVWTYTTVTT